MINFRSRLPDVIVDVRDDDFVGGNITGARNYPSGEFHNRLEDLIAETRDVPKVIFHCALSQQRGPKMARIYAEEVERRGARVELAHATEPAKSDVAPSDANKSALSAQSAGKGKKIDQEVIVLRGGFTRWQEKYKDDPKMVERYQAKYWAA